MTLPPARHPEETALKIIGRITKGTAILKEITTESTDASMDFRDQLEDCFVRLSRELDIPIPLWLKKNTNEFARYRKTFFPAEQFIDKVNFDKYEVRIEL